MASTIEERVVEMKFDNQEFERNVQTSISTLDKLKMALDLDGAAKGFNEIQRAADKVDLTGIEKGADAIAVKFSAMQIAGMTAISELTKGFLNFGKQLWNISFGQMKSGGMSRALKIEQAEFKLKALAKNIQSVGNDVDGFVKKMSDAASAAVTGTAYGYDSAMSVVSQLVASGVQDAEKMEGYLKGIAGAAAMTGRSFDDIGNIFTTIASNGKLMTMQLRQFSAAGLNVSAELARQENTTEEAINNMVSKGQIGFEKFADALNKAFGDSAQEADKTYSGVLTNVKAALSRIGQLFAAPYIQNMVPVLQKLKAALNQLNAALKPVAARITTIMEWLSDKGSKAIESIDFSRLDYFLRGIENIFWSIAMIIEAVRRGFLEIFPPKTQQQLEHAAMTFELFTENLIPTREALDGITGIVKAILIPVKIAVKLIKAVIKAANPIVVLIFEVIYAIVALVGHIGGIAGALSEVIEESKIFETLFQIIATTVSVVIVIILDLLQVLGQLMDMIAASGVGERLVSTIKDIATAINRILIFGLAVILEVVEKILSHVNLENIVFWLQKVVEVLGFAVTLIEFFALSFLNAIHILANSDTIVGNLFRAIKNVFDIVYAFFKGDKTDDKVNNLKDTLTNLKNELRALGDVIVAEIQKIKGQDVVIFAFSVAIIALVASLVVLFKNLGDLVYKTSNLVGTFGSLAATIRSIRHVAEHAKMFLYFGGAIMLITGALYELSKIPKDKLIPAAIVLGTMATAVVTFAVLMVIASRKLKIAYSEGYGIKAIGISMAGFAAAILAMSFSLKLLTSINMDLETALKTIGTITAIMVALGGVSIAVMKWGDPAALASAGLGFVGYGVAITILVNSLKTIQEIQLDDCVDNIIALGGIIIAVGAAIMLTSKATIGSAMAIAAYSLLLLSIVKIFTEIASMDTSVIEAGLSNIMLVLERFLPVIVVVGLVSGLAKASLGGIAGIIVGMIAFVMLVINSISILAAFGDLSKIQEAARIIEGLIWTLTICIGLLVALVGVIDHFNGTPTSTLISSVTKATNKGKETSKTLQKATRSITSLVGILIGFAVAVNLLTIPLLAMGVVDTDILIKGFIAISVLMFLVSKYVSGLFTASQFTGNSKAVTVIAAMLGMLTLVAGLVAGIIMVSWIYNDEQVERLVKISNEMALVFVALGILFWTMSKLPTGMLMNTRSLTIDEQENQTVQLIAIIAGITTMFAIFAKLFTFFFANYDPATFSDQVTQFGLLLGTFGALILAIVVAIRIMSKTKMDQGMGLKVAGMAVALTAIAAGITAFVSAIAYIAKDLNDDQIKQIGFVAGMIVAFFAAMLLIFKLMANGFRSVEKNADALFGIFSADSISKYDFIGMAGAFGLMISGVMLFASAISMMNNFGSLEGIVFATTALILLLGEVAAIMGFVGESEKITPASIANCQNFAVATVALSAAVIPMAAALTAIIGYNWKDILRDSGILLGSLAVLSVGLYLVMRKMDKANFKEVSGLIAFGLAVSVLSSTMLIIAEAMKMMDGVVDKLGATLSLGVMSSVLLGWMAIISLITTNSTSGSWSSVAAIVAVGVSSAAFGVAMLAVAKALNDIKSALPNPTEYITYMNKLLVMFGVLSAVLIAVGILSAVTSGLGAVGIAAMGVSFVEFGAACYLLAAALSNLVNAFTDFMNAFAIMGSMTQEDSDRARAAMVNMAHGVGDFMKTLMEEVNNIKTGIKALLEAVALAFVELLPQFAAIMITSGYLVIINFVTGLLKALDPLLAAFDLLVAIIYNWAMQTEAFYEIGAIIGKAVVDGIVGAFDGITGRIRDIMDGKRDELSKDITARDTRGMNAVDVLGMSAAKHDTLSEVFGYNFISGTSTSAKDTVQDFQKNIDILIDSNNMLLESLETLNNSGDLSGLSNYLSQIDDYEKAYANYVNDHKHWNDMLSTGTIFYTDPEAKQNMINNLEDISNNLSTYQQLIFAYQEVTKSTTIDEETRAEALGRLRLAMAELNEEYKGHVDNELMNYSGPSKELEKYIDHIGELITITDDYRTEREKLYLDLVSQGKTLDLGWGTIGQSTIENPFTSLLPTAEEYEAAANANTTAYIEEQEFVLNRYSAAGGRGNQGFVKVLPKSREVKAIAQDNATTYVDTFNQAVNEEDKDSVIDSLKEVGTGMKDGITDAMSGVWEWASNDPTIKGMVDKLQNTITAGFADYSVGFDINGYVNILGGDKTVHDLSYYRNEGSRVVNGKELWELQGYASLDEFAQHHYKTEGYKSARDYFGLNDEIKKKTKELTDSITNATSGLGDYANAAGTAADATSHLEDSIKSALDIFSGFNVELDMTANDVLRSFSSQLVGVSSWSQELQALAGKGIAQEILDDLAEAGPESYNRVHALYTMSSAQLGLFNKMYSQKLSLEKNTANNIRASFDKNGQVIVEAAENVGIEAGQAIQEGINESASTRVGVNEMEQGVLDAYKLGYEFEYINGVIIPEGIKESLTKATPGVAAIFGEMGYQSMEAFMHYMNVEDAITMVEGFQETLKDSINNSLNIFDAVSEKEEISAEEMLTRMKENVKNVGKWARNLQELAARGMDEALLAELQALGPEGADKVAAFTKMTDAQLAQANQAFAAKAALPQYVADNLTKSYAEAGYNTTLGFVEGIDPTAADEVMTALGTYSLDALKAALDINSPSEKTREAGMYTVAGYVLGVTENLPLLQDLGTQMGNTLIDSVFTVDPEKITESVSTFFGTIRSIIQAAMESEEIDSQPRLKLSPVISEGRSSADYKRAITVNDLKMSDMMDRQESRARAATMSPNAQRDYSSDLKSINQTLISTRDDLSLMRKDIMNLQTAFAGLNVTLDGASVGKVITPYVNQNLGQSYVNSKRRSMR